MRREAYRRDREKLKNKVNMKIIEADKRLEELLKQDKGVNS